MLIKNVYYILKTDKSHLNQLKGETKYTAERIGITLMYCTTTLYFH